MRILWLSHRDVQNPRAGGAERTAFEIGRRLAARGHSFTIVSGAWRGAPKRALIDGVQIIRAGRWILPHAVGFQERLTGSYDIVVEDLAHVLPWGVGTVPRYGRIAYFRHLHARTLRGQVRAPLARALGAIERGYARLYDGIPFVTESRSSVADLLALGVPEARIARIPPGVDLRAFHPGPRTELPTLAYFGGLRPYKRPEHAVKALAGLRSRGVEARLWIAGVGPSLSPIRQLVNRLQLGASVEVVGHLSQAELAARLRGSWANVHTSTSEGWCLSAMEAAASGVPTVGYRVPGLTDSVADGESGLLVPDGDLDSLVAGLLRILERPDWLRELSRRHASSFSWEVTAEKWQGLIASTSRLEGSKSR